MPYVDVSGLLLLLLCEPSVALLPRLLQARCFRYEGRTDAEQYSLVPEEGQAGVTWHTLSPDMNLE